MEKTKRYFIDPESVGFFKAILESYEDVGIFSVIDGKAGLVEIIYSVFFEDDLAGIIESMVQDGIQFREVNGV